MMIGGLYSLDIIAVLVVCAAMMLSTTAESARAASNRATAFAHPAAAGIKHLVRAEGRAVLHDLVRVAVRPELRDCLRHGDEIREDPAGRGRQDKSVAPQGHLLHDPVDPRLPRRERKGSISTFRASALRTRTSPLSVFCMKWMVMLPIMSAMRQMAAATSGASIIAWYPAGQITPGDVGSSPMATLRVCVAALLRREKNARFNQPFL